jgi:hypothetical protein
MTKAHEGLPTTSSTINRRAPLGGGSFAAVALAYQLPPPHRGWLPPQAPRGAAS